MAEPIESVSLRQLRALVAIGETASFTAAGERLGLSQPSVSHLIRRLEAEVGQPLVVRGREVSLTRDGQAMVDAARRAILAIDSSIQECREHSDLKQGKVMVAVGHVTAATLLPHILLEFRQRHPQLDLIVVDCMVQQIRTRLFSHEADVGLGAVMPDDDSRIMVEQLSDSGVALFVRADHPLARHDEVDAKVLAELPCIQLNPEAPAWLNISRRLIAANIYPRVEQRVVLLSTAIGLIQAGMGVAMLPQISRGQMPAGIKGIALRNPALEWPISIARLANYPLSPAAQAFVAVVRSVSQRLRREAAMP